MWFVACFLVLLKGVSSVFGQRTAQGNSRIPLIYLLLPAGIIRRSDCKNTKNISPVKKIDASSSFSGVQGGRQSGLSSGWAVQ
jgi:hypothetical protein